MDRENMLKEVEDVILDIYLFLKHEFGNEFGSELAKNVKNLSHNQQIVLFLIGNKGIKQVKDLASYLNISPSAVSQIIAKLEMQNIVKRKVDRANRRSILIEIEPKGREILDEMGRIKSIIFLKYVSKMEAEDLVVLKKSFKKFHQAIATNKEDNE